MASMTVWANLRSKLEHNLNFFRLHVLFFTFAPLVFSAVFYAANGQNHISFIDALFNCVSAITVCGLVTSDLSSLTGFQQALLFVQAAIGNHVVVSWVIVYIRRWYFNKKLEYIVDAEIAKHKALEDGGRRRRRGAKLLRRFTHAFTSHTNESENESEGEKKSMRPDLHTRTRNTLGDIRPDAIRHTSDAPRRINPSGLVTDSASPSQTPTLQSDRHPTPGSSLETAQTQVAGLETSKPDQGSKEERERERERASVVEGYFGPRVETPGMSGNYRSSEDIIIHDDRTYIPPGGAPLGLRRRTDFGAQGELQGQSTAAGATPKTPREKNTGYGGFPYPTTILFRLLRRVFPGMRLGLTRAASHLPGHLMSTHSAPVPESNGVDKDTNTMEYFSDSFHAPTGRNSKFYSLTQRNMEELGGVEYRALNALLWIVAIYHIAVHVICFTIIAPYMSLARWKSDFTPPNLHRSVPPVWYSAFQVVSAYTTTGMSLVDQSMVPFQEAYPLVLVCAFLILAGNLAFPIFLRIFIWSIMKLVPSTRLNETLHFLLDHPRRCYIYLFPSHQTWLLFWVVFLLTVIFWFGFLVLNIGESTIEAIPFGVRFVIGLLQSTSVRAAGFATTSLLSIAPALQVLFIIGMYLGVYPIALSVQATNVYEEKSLGVFEEDEDEEEPKVEGSGVAFYGRYLAWHARRQLAFDMWWLGLALFLFCIIERGKIQNQDNFQFFTIFAILFDLISAYGGVGMSLGLPYANYSFSGALSTLSKLIMIAVMIRGRHRGLPVAIDRAVMLPFEFKKADPARGYFGGDGGGGPNEGEGEGGDRVSVIMDGTIGESGVGVNKRRMTKKEG